MRPRSRFIATAALGAASLAGLAAPAPSMAQIDPASCLLTVSLATPRPAATPAGNQIQSPVQAWLTAPLTDACSGTPFTLAQFAPKAVYVHPMATW